MALGAAALALVTALFGVQYVQTEPDEPIQARPPFFGFPHWIRVFENHPLSAAECIKAYDSIEVLEDELAGNRYFEIALGMAAHCDRHAFGFCTGAEPALIPDFKPGLGPFYASESQRTPDECPPSAGRYLYLWDIAKDWSSKP